ncbi:unnamed protein product [Rodentolepis nana]|uniref:MAM domain-containing protein n=1 Tax=Rodentolepis nana TaxID=102285 RepID=A0A0R3T522_RODNA|nr:unnamed protein product [Rodentolepis nana]
MDQFNRTDNSIKPTNSHSVTQGFEMDEHKLNLAHYLWLSCSCLLASQYLWLSGVVFRAGHRIRWVFSISSSGEHRISWTPNQGWTPNQVGLLRLDTESGGSSPFPPLNTESELDTKSGGSSPFPPVGYISDGSSPFPHVGYIWWVFSVSSCFTSGGSSPFPPVGYRSDGSSPFPHVGYIWWVFSVSSCYIEYMWVECILSICEGVLMVECILPIFEGVLPGNPSSKLSNGFDSWPLRSLNSATDSILGHGSLNSATASILGNRVSRVCRRVPLSTVSLVRSLNSATASILGQGMSEIATVHCFSFVEL